MNKFIGKRMTSKNKTRKVHHNIVPFKGSYSEFDYHIKLGKSIQVSLTLHIYYKP